MYSLFSKLLFTLDPERAHTIALRSLQLIHQLGVSHFTKPILSNPRTIMGLTFPNPLGLAAGLDKNADYLDALAMLGFGFIEIGTVTPRPQPGNPRPRLFRLTDQQAIINRMGFNNKGIEYVRKKLETTQYRGLLGVNIGKNRDTPLDQAINDYLLGFRAFWPYASYITINISSPNTPGLRDLQQSQWLTQLLTALKHEQSTIKLTHHKYVPLVIKLSPDLSEEELKEIAAVLLVQNIDGIIATNTTLQRDGLASSPYAHEAGGLSGKPLQPLSTHTTRQLHELLQHRIPIIAAGGIMDETSAQEKYQAGASLLQIYTSLIYVGPLLVRRLAGMSFRAQG